MACRLQDTPRLSQVHLGVPDSLCLISSSKASVLDEGQAQEEQSQVVRVAHEEEDLSEGSGDVPTFPTYRVSP